MCVSLEPSEREFNHEYMSTQVRAVRAFGHGASLVSPYQFELRHGSLSGV